MGKVVCKTLVLAKLLDEGIPDDSIFRVEETEMDLESLKATVQENGILVQLLVASADPFLRRRIKPVPGGFTANTPMSCYVAGKILASKHPSWVEGDLFGAFLPLVTIQVIQAANLAVIQSWKLTGLIEEDQISYGVGVLGMTGSTAYAGVQGILRPNSRETLFISAASGAVGGLVCMLAKHLYNCKVIGSCGGDGKCTFAKDFYHFDHTIDYKKASNSDELISMLKEVAPEGIDMYFENVGGMHFEAAFNQLRPYGRIALCGMISNINKKENDEVSFDAMKMVHSHQRMEGFMCADWLVGKKGNFLSDMSTWLKEGHIKAQETFFDGIEQWPSAFQSLFTGKNLGKVVVRL
jgi:NADPH-dependent curcumin reductase CurA